MFCIKWTGGSSDHDPWHADKARAATATVPSVRDTDLRVLQALILVLHLLNAAGTGFLKQPSGSIEIELRIAGLNRNEVAIVRGATETLDSKEWVMPTR